jgi:putative ABC transport system permease protein
VAAAEEGDAMIRYSPTPLEPPKVAIRMAIRGLASNRLRALLTMLGVIIGVGAVIIAIGIGQGSRAAVSESIQKLGTNVLTVVPGQQKKGQISFGFGSRSTLKYEDAEAILKGAPSVAAVDPEVNGNAQVKYKSKNTNTTISGVSSVYPSTGNHAIKSGRFFTAIEQKALRQVVVLGSTIAEDLFDKESPVGKTIRIGGHNYHVIGVFKKKGGMGFRSPDDAVYVPVTCAMKRLFGKDSVQNIVCQAKSFDQMKKAQAEITAVLKKQHRIAAGADADFMIMSQADLAESQNAQQDTFTSLITCLAIVSLAVGGIGIMNIMLVSVTERTREIGVRKAIGARRRDVLYQFLFEAMFMSLVGGLLGVIFGVLGAKFVGLANNWTIVIQPMSIVLSFGFSAVVGVFFGFYPALKASRLRPVEALRFE